MARSETWKKYTARAVFILVGIGFFGRPMLMKVYVWFMRKYFAGEEE